MIVAAIGQGSGGKLNQKKYSGWREAYFVGGAAWAWFLLLLRVGTLSLECLRALSKPGFKGNFWCCLQTGKIERRVWPFWWACWYVVSVLISLQPEFGIALHATGKWMQAMVWNTPISALHLAELLPAFCRSFKSRLAVLWFPAALSVINCIRLPWPLRACQPGIFYGFIVWSFSVGYWIPLLLLLPSNFKDKYPLNSCSNPSAQFCWRLTINYHWL